MYYMDMRCHALCMQRKEKRRKEYLVRVCITFKGIEPSALIGWVISSWPILVTITVTYY